MMSTTEKKNSIINALNRLEDDAIIDEVYKVLYPDEPIALVMKEDLPEDLQLKLNKAMADYRTGNYISHNQMKEKMHEWLKA